MRSFLFYMLMDRIQKSPGAAYTGASLSGGADHLMCLMRLTAKPEGAIRMTFREVGVSASWSL